MLLHLYFHTIKLLKRLLDWVARLLFDDPLPPPTDEEQRLIQQLRENFAVELNGTAMSATWRRFVSEFRALILERDPREFLRWPLVQRMMFITNAPYVFREFCAARRSSSWSRYRSALRESMCGHPLPFLLFPSSSGNLIHHAYHLLQLEKITGATVSGLKTAVEFGGGYGSMCRLVHQLGFTGKYIIYDLPQFSLLQEFYLQSLKLPVGKTIRLVNDAAALKCELETEEEPSAFIATWSLSESPIEVRREIWPLVRNFTFFLIAFQTRFDSIDNCKDFQALQEESANFVSWRTWPIRHMREQHYLIGSSSRHHAPATGRAVA